MWLFRKVPKLLEEIQCWACEVEDEKKCLVVDLFNREFLPSIQIWDDIHSGRVEENSSLLLRFLVISFAELKKWSFHYWFAFPALHLDPPARLISLRSASECLSSEEELLVSRREMYCNEDH